MKFSLLWSLTLAVSAGLIVDRSFADSRQSCAERRGELIRQIERADAADNIYRKAGLEQALANVERYCREPSLEDEHERAIQKAEAEVRRRQNHLKAARQYGDVKVIQKHEARLERAEAKLQRLMDE